MSNIFSRYKIQAIKADKSNIETYTEAELELLLKKPNIKKCTFAEDLCWVMTNFLFSTGVRQRSLINIKIKEVDLDNNVVYVTVTKNRKPLIVPLNRTMVDILSDYLKTDNTSPMMITYSAIASVSSS